MNPLSDAAVARFIDRGFVRLDGAFSAEQAQAAVSVLFGGAGIDLEDPSSWNPPVVRIDGSTHPLVVETINTSRLTAAIDQVVGVSRWQRRSGGFGSFPIRFPSSDDPGDAGWHIDGSFGDPPFYKVNLASRGRALLLLMLYTDVGARDAPTRIRVGSQAAVARALARLGDDVTCHMTGTAPV